MERIRKFASSKDPQIILEMEMSGLTQKKVVEALEAMRVVKSIRYQDCHLGKKLDKAPTDQEIMSIAAPFSCFNETMCLWNLREEISHRRLMYSKSRKHLGI